jgi:hypothetical protein
MKQETIERLYNEVVLFLQANYLFDPDSKYPRSAVYEDYLLHQKLYKTPDVPTHHMGYIVRYAFPRMVGTRTQVMDENGTRIDCYFLQKCKYILFIFYSF